MNYQAVANFTLANINQPAHNDLIKKTDGTLLSDNHCRQTQGIFSFFRQITGVFIGGKDPDFHRTVN
ncbi:hypothetical protein BB987_13615 [Photorhabdus temperata]|nr:hypothetical protein BB987_13615 [Photorhabdus temperata]